MSINISQSFEITVNGISPNAGAGMVLLANPSLNTANTIFDDYVADTFTLNPSVATPVPIISTGTLDTGDIAGAYALWVQTDQPITINFVQNLVTSSVLVDSFFYLSMAPLGGNPFKGPITFTNNSTVTAAHLTIVMCGDRTPNPGTPGGLY
jgi:hypothetical protein